MAVRDTLHSSVPSRRITLADVAHDVHVGEAATVSDSAASVAPMGDDHERPSVGRVDHALLAHRLDADLVLGEVRGHRGQHAGRVGDIERDVVAGRDPPIGASAVRRMRLSPARGCR